MSWDNGVDYEETKRFLIDELRKASIKEGVHAVTRRLYLIISLTQLRNGTRLKEAIRFVDFTSRTFEREGYVDGTRGKKRKMVLPEEITKADLLIIRGALEERLAKGEDNFVVEISTWARRALGINTYAVGRALKHYLARKYPGVVR